MRVNQYETKLIILLLSLACLIAAYWASRYAGFAMDGDATRLTQYADGIIYERALDTDLSYSNGYGYSALLAFLTQMTGITVQHLQLMIGIWLSVLTLAAYLAYRELLGDVRLAVTGVILLLIQPDFLFYVMRGSHEKTTWTFGLLILWMWLRTRHSHELNSRIPVILALYLFLWALITNNAFFGSATATAFLLAALANFVIQKLLPLAPWISSAGRKQRSVLYTLLLGYIFVFVFVTYVYPPARSYYNTLGSMAEKIYTLFFGSAPITKRAAVSQTYSYVQTAWISQPVYLVLTGFQWSIALISFAAWLRDGITLLRHGQQRLAPSRMLLWIFYLGFAAQLGLAVISDLSGAMGSNLQVRMFTPFTLVSSPMAATWLHRAGRFRLLSHRFFHLLAIGLGCVAIGAALLKMVNDPTVGNQWLFYGPDEQVAADWVENYLADGHVWNDTSIHQIEVLLFRKGYHWRAANTYGCCFMSDEANRQYTHILLTDLTILQANRSLLELPMVIDHNIVYDNGHAKLYHRRPHTQFQK